MSCNGFHGPHSDTMILRLFWPPIPCREDYGSDFLGVALPGFVTARSTHPIQGPKGWVRVVSTTLGSTTEAPFGSLPRAA